MLVFDQLKKNDAQLRVLAVLISAGLCALLGGLWWIQIVNTSDFRSSLEMQTFRTVRLPAIRGKILDRNNQVLAESRATYNVSIFLEDLSLAFQKEYKNLRPRVTVTNSLPFYKRWLGINPVKTSIKRLSESELSALQWEARYRVVSNTVRQLSIQLNTPLTFDREKFKKHYEVQRAMPFIILPNATRAQLARFEESASNLAAELEIQNTRVYPHRTTASHLLGYVVRRNDSVKNEQSFYTYRLPDFTGLVGIEGKFDLELRGAAGEKTVVVNNLGYRQAETVVTPTEVGRNVVLTIDLAIQQEAEKSMRNRVGPNAKGAVVVMDVNTGDILALSSSPTSDPNNFITGFNEAELARWKDEDIGVQKNRATGEHYQAGSIFKTMVALAALENGLNPNETVQVQPNPRNTSKGIFYLGNQVIHDTAPPGPYDLRRALARSSNTYFVTNGLRPNVFPRLVELGRRLHLGEYVGMPLKQETAGHFPRAETVRTWTAGEKANICIGQGQMDVNAVQMAVMTAALANGGKVLQPRLVDRLESQDLTGLEPATSFPKGIVRDQLGIAPRHMQTVREAMLAETEDPEGTGHRYVSVPGLRVCGKTGTAERTELGVKRNTTWFISYAPYENPKYAVVVMVEDGESGGKTCAPVASDVYIALTKSTAPNTGAVARGN